MAKHRRNMFLSLENKHMNMNKTIIKPLEYDRKVTNRDEIITASRAHSETCYFMCSTS